MSSPDQNALAQPHHENDLLENELVVDQNDGDSTYGGSDGNSETTSMSSLYKGYYENGRRYQNVSSEDYLMPADEKQWASMEAGHLLFLILDSQRSNTLFRSPISSKARHILDIGTGSGEWAIDVADKFPQCTVRGVDLYPPPQPWTAPNCIYEVDDVTRDWTWSNKFDFVHLRRMLGAMNTTEYNKLYQRIYDNLEPGGWIEQVEEDIDICCDDDSLPVDSLLATQWGTMFKRLGQKAGRPIDNYSTMRSGIEAAGFVNVHQQDYKCPIGAWPSLPAYKDAGKMSMQQFKAGMEGWVMMILTRFGEPKPWSAEQVQVYLAKIRKEVDSGWHIYQRARRVWAQKPFDEPKKVQDAELESLK